MASNGSCADIGPLAQALHRRRSAAGLIGPNGFELPRFAANPLPPFIPKRKPLGDFNIIPKRPEHMVSAPKKSRAPPAPNPTTPSVQCPSSNGLELHVGLNGSDGCSIAAAGHEPQQRPGFAASDRRLGASGSEPRPAGAGTERRPSSSGYGPHPTASDGLQQPHRPRQQSHQNPPLQPRPCAAGPEQGQQQQLNQHQLDRDAPAQATAAKQPPQQQQQQLANPEASSQQVSMPALERFSLGPLAAAATWRHANSMPHGRRPSDAGGAQPFSLHRASATALPRQAATTAAVAVAAAQPWQFASTAKPPPQADSNTTGVKTAAVGGSKAVGGGSGGDRPISWLALCAEGRAEADRKRGISLPANDGSELKQWLYHDIMQRQGHNIMQSQRTFSVPPSY